jgi:outer membrane protein
LKFFIFFLITIVSLFANDNTVRLAYGKASNSDLGQIITFNSNNMEQNFQVLSINGAFLLGDTFFELPFKQYSNISFSYFKDNSIKDSYELAMFLKLFYEPKIFKNYVRVGFGEGFSYTNAIVKVELLEAQDENGKNSKFLNYLDLSIDFNLGKIFNQNNLYMGFLIKHRSGIFGLINNVKHGGSNYNCLYLEKTF